jgi:uncharacterized protein YceK
MKYLVLALIVIALSGCSSVGYDQTDAENDRRQDLIGYILGLEEKPSE